MNDYGGNPERVEELLQPLQGCIYGLLISWGRLQKAQPTPGCNLLPLWGRHLGSFAGEDDIPSFMQKVCDIRRLAGKPLIIQQNLPCSFCQAAETAALPGPQYDKFLSFETASGEPPHMNFKKYVALAETAALQQDL